MRRFQPNQKGLVPPENIGARLAVRKNDVARQLIFSSRAGILRLMVDIPGGEEDQAQINIVRKIKINVFGRRMILLPGSDQIGEKG
jgi:hypothetical protein